jgi:hypothetical protein
LAAARSITGKREITKEERKLAKAVNFGLIFGQGAEMTLQEATAYRARIFQTYKGGHRAVARLGGRQAPPREGRHPHSHREKAPGRTLLR